MQAQTDRRDRHGQTPGALLLFTTLLHCGRGQPQALSERVLRLIETQIRNSVAERCFSERRPHLEARRCGVAGCICGSEGLDIHALEPLLDPGFVLVAKRKVVRGQAQVSMQWKVPNTDVLVEEGGIDRTLQERWQRSPHPGLLGVDGNGRRMCAGPRVCFWLNRLVLLQCT
jgi:hypothetical protein